MLVIAAYSLELPAYACARYRVLGPASRLRGRVELRWGAASDGRDYAIDASAMDGADLILFQRYFPSRATWPLVERALSSGLPVIYETDDDFLHVPPDHPMAARLAPGAPHVAELAARASLVTVSTPALARSFRDTARAVRVLPNRLDERLWPVRPGGERSPGPLRVAYAGTPGRGGDFAEAAAALARVKARHAQALEVVFLGFDPGGDLADRVLPFREDYAPYARELAALAPDIALAPLADTAFNRCKSAVKWLEYSAAGAAGIFSDAPAYQAVRHGVTGLKASGAQGWEEALEALIRDEPLRLGLARAAQAEVFSGWGLDRGAEQFHAAWRGAAHGHP